MMLPVRWTGREKGRIFVQTTNLMNGHDERLIVPLPDRIDFANRVALQPTLNAVILITGNLDHQCETSGRRTHVGCQRKASILCALG
jgi:hypothetical protein